MRTGVKQYQVILKAVGGNCWPEWLQYRVYALTALEAIENARKQASTHYICFERFELQTVGEVHN